jgi:hypothetical protein
VMVNHIAELTAERKIGQKAVAHLLGSAGMAGLELARGRRDLPEIAKDMIMVNGAIALSRSTGFRTLGAVELNKLSELMASRDAGRFFEYAGIALRPKQSTTTSTTTHSDSLKGNP